MMRFNRQYFGALTLTSLMVIVIHVSNRLLYLAETFSFLWFVGVINLMVIFILIFYINYKFLCYINQERKGDDLK